MVVVGAAAFPIIMNGGMNGGQLPVVAGAGVGQLGCAIGSRIRRPETGDRILPGKRRANPGPAIGPDQAGQGREELTRA